MLTCVWCLCVMIWDKRGDKRGVFGVIPSYAPEITLAWGCWTLFVHPLNSTLPLTAYFLLGSSSISVSCHSKRFFPPLWQFGLAQKTLACLYYSVIWSFVWGLERNALMPRPAEHLLPHGSKNKMTHTCAHTLTQESKPLLFQFMGAKVQLNYVNGEMNIWCCTSTGNTCQDCSDIFSSKHVCWGTPPRHAPCMTPRLHKVLDLICHHLLK